MKRLIDSLRVILLITVIIPFIAVGCGKKEDDLPQPSPHKTGEIPLNNISPAESPVEMKGPVRTEVPEDITAFWKGIKVEVVANETGKKETLTLEIGKSEQISGSDLNVKALNFLPSFKMDGQVVTSTSNETTNPASQVVVYEGDKEIFRGWLFALFPTTHAFLHPKYSIILLEGVKAGK